MARHKKATTKKSTKRPIESYEHRDKVRVNNPPVGLVTPDTDPDTGQKKKTYAYDPHLDPQLVWAGKAEHTSFEVPTVSLHVHERIDPRTIIEAVRKKNGNGQPVQGSLFEEERTEPLRHAVEFYQHKHGWSNRLIAGDSLLVMNSLLEKEGMAGKVQMIYIDPPYGIRYGSNFQPFVNKRDVKDGSDEDLTLEPETLKAFRDTWELGIHSYLTYLRDRLLLARELLHESGSCFVQISDENVHHVRELMDEVFDANNFMALINYRSMTALGQSGLASVYDYIIWYAKDYDRVKFRPIYERRLIADEPEFAFVDTADGNFRRFARAEVATFDEQSRSRIFKRSDLTSSGYTESCTFDFEFQGRECKPSTGKSWRTHREGVKKLITANRLFFLGERIYFKQYHSDFGLMQLENSWHDTAAGFTEAKIFVVQTSPKVVERCLLMTTDPGDLVFDPTCGSGTTAYVAEQWGRRWITCDTSRVAITLARQRLMTAVFDYYELAHPEEGVGSGFKYKTVPHVTLKSIANNPEIDGIYARMRPAIERALQELNAALKSLTSLTPGPSAKGKGELNPPHAGESGRRLGEGYPRFRVTQGGRAGQTVDFAAPDSATFTMPSGQVVKVNELVEWEVPFEFPADWPDAARRPFDAFHAARRAMQKEIDAAIARHAPQETLYDQPLMDRKKVRVTGPFTVEAVPAPSVRSVDELIDGTPHVADASIARYGETLRQGEWRDELLRTGIRGKGGQHIRFARLEPLPGCRWLHADGETKDDTPQRIVVSFGPEHAPLEQRQVAQAIEEALTLVPNPRLIVFAAFQFDPEAARDIDETNWPGVTLLKAQMNADLLTEDLKKKRASNESFWLIGQPDVRIEKVAKGEDKGKFIVSVHGFDYYNTKTGGIESGGADRIAVWMLDTDYDGRSLYPHQVFFPMAGEKDGWARLAKSLKTEIDEERIEAYRGTVSLPFEAGAHKRIAVKIVDDRGIESLKVMGLS